MDIKNYIARNATAVGIGAMGMAMAFSPDANAGERAKNFFKTFYKAPAAAIMVVPKVVHGTVKELNPVAGLRRGLVDVVETTAVGLVGEESARPQDYGRVNQGIDERPVLKFFVDVGVGAGVGVLAGEAIGGAGSGKGYGALIGAGSQVGVAHISEAYGRNHENVYALEFTAAEVHAKRGNGVGNFAKRSSD